MVYGRRVAQCQPPVFCPAEQGNIVLIRLEVGRHHREKGVGDKDVRALVAPEQGGRGQVVELGQVRAPVPVYGQLGQLVQGPVIPLVAAAELLNVEIGRHGVGVDVQALGKKVLALLGVILRLEAVVQDFLRADAHPIGRVGHRVDLRVREVYRPVLDPLRGAAHEDEILVILYGAVQHLPAVFQPLPQKRLFIVPGGGNADQQLIGIGLHGLFE